MVFNSLAGPPNATANGLTPIGLYDKIRLVPFGEPILLDALATRLGNQDLCPRR